MNQYKPYQAYKDSGVEWLDYLPAHWDAKSLKRLAEIENSGCYGAEESSLDSPIGIKTSTTAHITSNGNFLIEEMPVRYFTVAEADRYSGKTGDIFVVKSSGSNTNIISGKLARIQKSSGKIVFTNFLMRVRANNKIINPVFLEYFLRCTITKRRIEKMVATTTYPNIDVEEYSLALVPIPPMKEQLQICTALDRETTRIDALVAKKTRFIELLREKRQALITHAVTKGLDPNVNMKDSGVEWLGAVPEHWLVRPLKGVVATPITDGPHETPNFLDGGIPFVSAEAVSGGFLNFEKIRGFISLEDHERYSKKYKPKRFDIYMIKSGATTGVTAIVDTDRDFNIWSPLAVIRCSTDMSPYFVLFFMRSRSFQEAVAINWSFGTQQNIGMGVIGNLQITVPPLIEQQKIALHIKNVNNRFDALIEKTERSIELLKERRSALITAAVTGQIDLQEGNQ